MTNHFPKLVKIDNAIFKVIRVPKTWKTKNENGKMASRSAEIDYRKQIIKVCKDYPLFVQKNMLWHEITHMLMDEWANLSVHFTKQYNKEEAYCDWFALRIQQILMDNPELVKLTMEGGINETMA